MKHIRLTLLTLLLVVLADPVSAQVGLDQSWQKHGSVVHEMPVPMAGNTLRFSHTGKVLLDGDRYRYYYAIPDGSTYKIHVLSSTDLESGWQPESSAAILEGASDWDAHVLAPSVLRDDDGTYKMWYAGDTDPGGFTPSESNIGLATSTDGVVWTRHGNTPVLATVAGTWESRGVSHPYVIKDGDVYRMWYVGIDAGSFAWRIGYATSTDGVAWVRSSANPILETRPTAFDSGLIWGPVVLKQDGRFLMWYTGMNFGAPGGPSTLMQTGFAASDDGETWTRGSTGSPVLPASDSPGSYDASMAIVLGVFAMGDGSHKMLYYAAEMPFSFGLSVATLAAVSTASESDTPVGFRLAQNYPNPFNPATSVEFELDQAGPVRLSVFDMLGNEVAVLVDGFRPAGSHRVRLRASDLASGSYLYRLEAGSEALTRIMHVLK